MNSLQKTPRATTVLMLIIAVIALVNMIYLPSAVIMFGDAATTANHIKASLGFPPRYR